MSPPLRAVYVLVPKSKRKSFLHRPRGGFFVVKIMKNNKSIAILGGMGPQASAKLLQVIIDMATHDYSAKNDDDYPEIIVDSVPVPDFISNKQSVETVRAMLQTRVKKLQMFNPASFSIACNTVHILLKELQAVTKTLFISIIEEVVREVSDSKISRVGLLGTPVTLESRLYQSALEKRNIQTFIPSIKGQLVVERIIRNILAGKLENSDRKKLVKIADTLRESGTQGIILGCTELPLIFPKTYNVPIFDSIEILAKALLKNYYT